MLLKVAVATTTAWWIGNLLGVPRPIFAVLAVIVSIQDDLLGSIHQALSRLVGVAAGVALGYFAERYTSLHALVIGVVMAIAFVVGDLLEAGPGVNTQVGVSALLVLATTATQGYAVLRLWETALGGASAIVIAGILWPSEPDPQRSEPGAQCLRVLTQLYARLGRRKRPPS